MDQKTTIAIKDNSFARQFETTVEQGLLSVEYSFQERKIFLTKIQAPEGFANEEIVSEFLTLIMEIAYERKLKVVPIFPKIAQFFKKNSRYKDLLPPGIKI